MKKIYHLFPAHTSHLTPNIIRNIIISSKYNHYFLIYLNDKSKKEIFTSFFEKINNANYAFIAEKSNRKERLNYYFNELRYPRYHLKYSDLEKCLYCNLLSIQIDNLIIHGELSMYGTGIYKTILALNIPTVWVCWGGIPRKHKEFYYIFTAYHYKTLFLKKLCCICTLTANDQIKLQELFGLQNTIFCPYYQNRQIIKYETNYKRKILVGNSGHYVQTYLEVIDMLKSLKNLDITFMVPYGLDNANKRKEYLDLKQKAYHYWGNNVHFWDKTLTYEDYEKEMSKYSVYICNVSRQTGLGAVNHCLYYGMKVYLKGTNYDHYSSMGFIVHKIDQLRNIKFAEDLYYISDREINSNKQKYLERQNQKEQRIKKWEEIFEGIIGINL